MRSIVLAFVLLLFLLPATVSSISISPLDDIVSTVDPGYFESVIFTISNGDNTTTNVSITIDSSLEGVAFFSETLFTVPGNSSRNVSCAISRDSEVTGQIHFTCNSTSIDVDVIVEGESTSTSDDIILIPSTPKAESNLIFIIPEQVDATGYMICYETNNAYVVDIKDGIGCVELGADYGETFVSISTNGHTYTQYFTIDAIFEDELFITIPPDIQVDDTVVFSVSALGLPILAEVTFTMGDETFKKLADESGSVSAVFKKSGNWTINATIFNVEKKEFFNVSPKPLTVSVPPGRYTIHATSTDREGTKQFTATMQTAIIIMDADGIEAEKIQAHKPYSLRVVDIDGKSVNSLIKVYGDNVLLKDIDADGSVLWKPDHQCTYYSFETEPYDLGYDTSSIGLYAVEITGNSIDTMQVIIVIIVVAFVAICVVIYFLKPEIIYALQEKFHKRTRKIRNRRAPI
jgi:hypothetical protein